MKTTLLRGYEWVFEDEDKNQNVWLVSHVEENVVSIHLDKVAQYSLLSFLARVLRRRANKRLFSKRKK